jgi:hypothetical protein
MEMHEFTIIASGLDSTAPDFEDRFFEAGCDDATLAIVNGRIVVEFQREARSFWHAWASAAGDVMRAGATVEHIWSDCP